MVGGGWMAHLSKRHAVGLLPHLGYFVSFLHPAHSERERGGKGRGVSDIRSETP